jgi:STAS-like domain of unknown function (DUF4325)
MIKPAEELSPVLASRPLGEELRERIQAAAEEGESVVVDFEGVETMSPSFADELFAKLPRSLTDSGQVRFENLGDDLLALVRFVVAGRPTLTDG